MSCCKCRLIDEDCAKKLAGINRSIQMTELERAFNLAHDNVLLKIIGKDCLDALCAAKEANTLSTPQSELLELIKPLLAEYIGFYYKSLATMQFLPGGVKATIDGGAESDRQIGMSVQLKSHQEMADVYRIAVIDYLKAHPLDFPCFTNIECKEDDENYIPIITSWT